ncbi:hypothetical protein, partial [Xanthomonas sacchari]|uniref:hypothetical protein n=1 Tax=Xanthomonas sacchari TaxID=56458 RepID=UPI00292AD01B
SGKKRLRAGELGPGSLALQNLQAARDIIDKLGSTAVASRFTGKIKPFFEEYLITETEAGEAAVPFGGRDDALAQHDAWLDNQSAPARLVLAAPAGRGKSALLVHWVQRLEQAGRLGPDAGAWQLVFVPISLRFNTNRPEVFYEALAARLAEILDQSLQPAHTDPAAYYED